MKIVAVAVDVAVANAAVGDGPVGGGAGGAARHPQRQGGRVVGHVAPVVGGGGGVVAQGVGGVVAQGAGGVVAQGAGGPHRLAVAAVGSHGAAEVQLSPPGMDPIYFN
jgi:hypothetical protein